MEQTRPPTYLELADLVCELVENNIANLDKDSPFVRYFTFSGADAPEHWHRAIALREALIANNLVPRQYREPDRTKIRSLRDISPVRTRLGGKPDRRRRTRAPHRRLDDKRRARLGGAK